MPFRRGWPLDFTLFLRVTILPCPPNRPLHHSKLHNLERNQPTYGLYPSGDDDWMKFGDRVDKRKNRKGGGEEEKSNK